MSYHLEKMINEYYYPKISNIYNTLQQDILNNYMEIIYLSKIEKVYKKNNISFYYLKNIENIIGELWKNIETNNRIINTLP